MSKLPAIYLMSDIHRDYGPFEWPDAAMSADLIIVAGDLANGEFDIEFLKKPNKPLIFVPGNHDFWSKDGTRDMFDMYADMKRASEGTNVHVLWDEEVVIAGVRILGTPLWGSFGGYNKELVRASFHHAHDYRYINAKSWYADPENLTKHRELKGAFKTHGRPDPEETGAFTPFIAYSMYQKSVKFLESRLSEKFDGPTILVTHMAPSYECLRKSHFVEEYRLDPANWHCRGLDNSELARVGGYVGDLSRLFERYRSELDLAVHGHIHSSVDIACGSTRVVSNPRGDYSGPLTKEKADGYRFFGIRMTEADIARSQATFAEYPYWGNNWGFEPDKIIRLEEGLAPVVRPWVEDAMPRLLELHAEMLELQPHVAHRTKVLRRSVQESAMTRVNEFVKLIESVLKPALQAFDSSSIGAGQWFGMMGVLGLPTPEHGMYARFEGLSPFDDKHSPRQEMANVVNAMSHVLKTLPLLPHVAEAARVKWMPMAEKILSDIRARGFEPVVENAPPARYWRKLHFNLGEVELDTTDEIAEELSTAADDFLRGGKGPRQASFSISAPYDPDAWKKKKPDAPSAAKGSEW